MKQYVQEMSNLWMQLRRFTNTRVLIWRETIAQHNHGEGGEFDLRSLQHNEELTDDADIRVPHKCLNFTSDLRQFGVMMMHSEPFTLHLIPAVSRGKCHIRMARKVSLADCDKSRH